MLNYQRVIYTSMLISCLLRFSFFFVLQFLCGTFRTVEFQWYELIGVTHLIQPARRGCASKC